MPNNLIYAAFGQRLMALILDFFIIALPILTLVFTFAAPLFLDEPAIKAATNQEFEIIYQLYTHGVFLSLSGLGVVALILALFTISKWQATPGKRLVSIYIIDKNGAKAKLGNAFGRFIALPLFLLTIQFFQRQETYQKLAALKASGKIIPQLPELQAYLVSPLSTITSIVSIVVMFLWFLKIPFSSRKTAIHDDLFNTRVVKGRK